VAAALAGDVGIVLAAAGVAETGSFLSADTSLATRLLGMLADTVYAILPTSSILPTLDEMGALLSQLSTQGNRYLSLVTGPSRTADIERVLTIGVQGPKVLHVLVLDGESGRETEMKHG
jgi:L-lactate dehydrogenase complex protein LldG